MPYLSGLSIYHRMLEQHSRAMVVVTAAFWAQVLLRIHPAFPLGINNLCGLRGENSLVLINLRLMTAADVLVHVIKPHFGFRCVSAESSFFFPSRASVLTFVEHIDSRKQYAVTWADL